MEYQIQNVSNINVSQNEVINKYTVNRNLDKLLDNDIKLAKMVSDSIIGTDSIVEFTNGVVYPNGKCVWFKLGRNGKNYIYLLESMHDNNNTVPAISLVDGVYTFEPSGWRDKNSLASLTAISGAIDPTALKLASKKLLMLHIYSSEHKNGELTSDPTQVNSKLLLTDMSNINPNRNNNFFPYTTGKLNPTETITSGFYRKWDNGVLEYDIIYKLGYIGKEIKNEVEYNVISCNNIELSDNGSLPVTSDDYNENSKYFATEDDYNIFKSNNPNGQVILKDMIQKNCNSIANVYGGVLEFPEKFKDLNYMVFGCDITRQERDYTVPTVDSGSNTIIYTDKTKKSLKPIYIVFPYEEKADITFGLVSNTFHCQIIGRWK